MTTTVYFLTNLSHAATLGIKNELETHDYIGDDCFDFPDNQKQFSYVYWPHVADGTGADILRITKEKDNAIFVDARSVVDKTVILASIEYYENGPQGEMVKNEVGKVAFGRCNGREALTLWVNLDIANMSLEEFIMEDELTVISDPAAVGTACT